MTLSKWIFLLPVCAIACGSSNGGGAAIDAATKADASQDGSLGEDAPVGVDCDYPATSNPTGCPASYSMAYSGQPCPAGLMCSYPGAGDAEGPSGCNATAILHCEVGDDAGPDAGTGAWVFAQ